VHEGRTSAACSARGGESTTTRRRPRPATARVNDRSAPLAAARDARRVFVPLRVPTRFRASCTRVTSLCPRAHPNPASTGDSLPDIRPRGRACLLYARDRNSLAISFSLPPPPTALEPLQDPRRSTVRERMNVGERRQERSRRARRPGTLFASWWQPCRPRRLQP